MATDATDKKRYQYPIPSPPLMTGDRLDAAEFLRRYKATDEGVKAELIEGMVVMASPVGPRHGRPHIVLSGWVLAYEIATPAIESYTDTTIEIDNARVPQPDLALMCLPPRPAQTRLSPQDRLIGCPELAIEVANSSARIDLGRKRRMYARAGAQEYLVWQARPRTATWLTRRGRALVPLEPDAVGVIRSRAFPGLWLDTRALADNDAGAVMACLHAGLASPDHAAFAAAGRA